MSQTRDTADSVQIGQRKEIFKRNWSAVDFITVTALTPIFIFSIQAIPSYLYIDIDTSGMDFSIVFINFMYYFCV